MAETAPELRPFEDASRLVARGELLVVEQGRRLERLRRYGYPTLEAAQILECLTLVLQALRETQRLVHHVSYKTSNQAIEP